MDLDRVLAAFRGKIFFKAALLLAAIISSLAYSYFFDHPSLNIRRQLADIFPPRDAYTFYSGANRGFYIEVGRHLERETNTLLSRIRIKNKETSGGYENAMKVMADPRSFGLVQEDTVLENDRFVRDHLQYVTPLYLERMHILVRTDMLKEFAKEDPTLADSPLILSTDTSLVEAALAKKPISTGPPGSGSAVFSRYLLAQLRVSPQQDRSLPFDEALRRLLLPMNDDDAIAAVFSIAGAPLTSALSVLHTCPQGTERPNGPDSELPGCIELVGVDPSVAQAMNDSYNLRLRPTNFRNLYPGGEGVPTFGSFAFLVASNKVPDFAIRHVAEVLGATKGTLRKDIQSKMRSEATKTGIAVDPGYLDENAFQLGQYDFLSAVRQSYSSLAVSLVRNIGILLATLTFSTVALFVSIVWIVSGIKQLLHVHVLTRIYNQHLPENTTLDEHKRPCPRPVIWENQSEIIAKLVRGIAAFRKLAGRIRHDHSTGMLMPTHHRSLLENLQWVTDHFRDNLAQRLNESVGSDGHSVDELLLRHLHTAGYLKRDDFLWLRNELRSTSGPSAR